MGNSKLERIMAENVPNVIKEPSTERRINNTQRKTEDLHAGSGEGFYRSKGTALYMLEDTENAQTKLSM